MDDDPIEALLQRGYRYALALTHDRAQAEDLLHDAWLGVHAHDPVDAAPYLLRAIRNRWIDQVRRRAVVPMVPLEVEPAEARSGADAALAVDDEVGRALASLGSDEREALYLHAVEGWTAAEIATLTERPRNTILTVLARARRRLAEWRAARALEVL
jgi:RNA polymerase sigma factor (sigma-70 family)